MKKYRTRTTSIFPALLGLLGLAMAATTILSAVLTRGELVRVGDAMEVSHAYDKLVDSATSAVLHSSHARAGEQHEVDAVRTAVYEAFAQEQRLMKAGSDEDRRLLLQIEQTYGLEAENAEMILSTLTSATSAEPGGNTLALLTDISGMLRPRADHAS